MGMPKYPCRRCVYSKTCGDNMRTAFCAGRATKTQQKMFGRYDGGVSHHADLVGLEDVPVGGFFCADRVAVKENVYRRTGVGRDGLVPYVDNIGVCYCTSGKSLVYPVSKELSDALWNEDDQKR